MKQVPVSVLELLKDTMEDLYIGSHQTQIDRIDQALEHIAAEKERKKKEAAEAARLRKLPKGKLDELFKNEELTPEQIAKARGYIEKLEKAKERGDYYEALQYKVPYFNQRDSEHGAAIADRMCNMTAMAMGLAYMGVSNPKPKMQYDDALEQIRKDHYPKHPRTSTGQMKVAEHLDFTFGSLDGKTEQTGLWGDKKSYDYNWYKLNVIPQLRAGHSVTIGIWDYTPRPYTNGHIVHLIAVTKEGLIVHDPYAKTNLLGVNYNKVMHTNANTRKEEGTEKGKSILWKFNEIKSSKAVYIAYIRMLKHK